MLLFLTAVTLALVTSFICSICEAVLLSINHSQVEEMARNHRRTGSWMRLFKRNIDIPIAAILIVNTVAHTVGATVAGATYADAFSENTLWLFSLIFTLAVLLFTEIIPKTLGVSFAGHLAVPVAWVIRVMTLSLGPFVRISERISRSLRGDRESPITSISEIRMLAKLGHAEGVVEPEAAGIIVGATRLSQLRVSDVMIPRNDVKFLSAQWSAEENLQVIRKHGLSRLPYSSTTDLDGFSGLVLSRELLFGVTQQGLDQPIDWSDYVREPLVVPETLQLSELLNSFKEGSSHLAVVVDEYGDLQGIVTLEDVLEEIVGEILDEYDKPMQQIWPQANGSLHARGSADLRDVCNYFDLEWDTESGTTSVNGLISHVLGDIPKRGDSIEWNGCRMSVRTASPRRAEYVVIERIEIENVEPVDG